MKIALTGSDGMLGHDIQKVFKDVELINFTLNDFDITDLDSTLSAIKEARPDYLIHPAAYTDVDGCEKDPETAYRVNALGAKNVTIACEETGCPVLYISTDYVFDGTKKEPYIESDAPNPLNEYGLSKLKGERFVSSLTDSFYIVRTSWLYGKNGKNFVETISRLLTEKDEIRVINDQTGSPTYTYDLALKLRELIGKGYGTYHVTNSSQCSWYEFAIEIAALKQSDTKVLPITSDEYKLPARRPSYSVLANTMLKHEGIKELRSWKEALREYVSL
ncbi:MAG TPA: dTDP-4-dehydrorhamnose reductase [Nitrospirae bacterium]|nr:dTDP-4-dehydrorhamnose reductase [Nitrospirota bacterium]